MALTILDVDAMKTLLTEMWKKNLNTSEDPANGQWYTNGPNGDHVGLYGGLTDSENGAVRFDLNRKHYSPTEGIVASSTVDNRNGLVSTTTVNLSSAYTDSVSTTNTYSHAIKEGFAFEVKAKGTLFGIGSEVTTKFNIDYTYTQVNSETKTQTQTRTATQSVVVSPPKGKVYEAQLIATTQELTVPFQLDVEVVGHTETWFEDRINGHYNWTLSIGAAFAIAGKPEYKGDPTTGKGLVPAIAGMLTAKQSTNFHVRIVDVTNAAPGPRRAAVSPGDELLPQGAIVISTTPVNVRQPALT